MHRVDCSSRGVGGPGLGWPEFDTAFAVPLCRSCLEISCAMPCEHHINTPGPASAIPPPRAGKSNRVSAENEGCTGGHTQPLIIFFTFENDAGGGLLALTCKSQVGRYHSQELQWQTNKRVKAG